MTSHDQEPTCPVDDEVRLAEEALNRAKRKVAVRAEVCADLVAAARGMRNAVYEMSGARVCADSLAPRGENGDSDPFFEDAARSALWQNLCFEIDRVWEAAQNAAEAAEALAEHIRTKGANI